MGKSEINTYVYMQIIVHIHAVFSASCTISWCDTFFTEKLPLSAIDMPLNLKQT